MAAVLFTLAALVVKLLRVRIEYELLLVRHHLVHDVLMERQWSSRQPTTLLPVVDFFFGQVRLELLVIHLTHSDTADLLQRQLLGRWLEGCADVVSLAQAIVKLQLPLGALAQAVCRQLMVCTDGARERRQHGRAVKTRVWLN